MAEASNSAGIPSRTHLATLRRKCPTWQSRRTGQPVQTHKLHVSYSQPLWEDSQRPGQSWREAPATVPRRSSHEKRAPEGWVAAVVTEGKLEELSDGHRHLLASIKSNGTPFPRGPLAPAAPPAAHRARKCQGALGSSGPPGRRKITPAGLRDLGSPAGVTRLPTAGPPTFTTICTCSVCPHQLIH